MNRTGTILVVGASVRAVAQSLHNDGFPVVAADLFGDADLQTIASVQRIDNYAQVKEHAWPVSLHGWLYTGGLENHATLVDEISSHIPLLGNRGDVLQSVRAVHSLQSMLLRHGLRMPEIVAQLPLDPAGDWLQKSTQSAGGLLVQRVGDHPLTTNDETSYFQRFIPGRTLGAQFVADAVRAHCLGITEQLTGVPWTAGQEFLYAGSLGPVKLADSITKQLQELGNIIAQHFQLRGWFGVDCILDAANQLWILEVNPRYSASLELCERAAGQSTARWHVQSCEGTLLNETEIAGFRGVGVIHGKAIVYAHAPVMIQADQIAIWLQQAKDKGDIADIPAIAGVIPRGLPIVTLFAAGSTSEEVRTRLAAAVNLFEQSLHYTETVASFQHLSS